MATPRKLNPQKGGRPTKYRESLIGAVDDYLKICVDEYNEFHRVRGDRTNAYDRLVKVNLPTMEGFSIYLDVHLDSLYEWADKYPKFSEALDKILKLQKERLTKGALSGEYNPTIAKLMLSSNHGMREKSDVTTGGKPIPLLKLENNNVLRDNSDEEDSESDEED